ncbi:hypothetical protein JCM11641_005629 [Rhodosporidiobolus odoratus]
MAVGTYVHRKVAAAEPKDHQTSFMTDAQLFATLLIILTFFMPPLTVFLERGCSLDFVLNLILTCLGFLPGLFESPIVYDASSYVSEPPTGGLTFYDILRAASDEDRAEKAKRKDLEKGQPSSSSDASDTDLDDAQEKMLSRAPTYRSTETARTAPPTYEESESDSDQTARYAAAVQMSEKSQGKRRELDDPGDYV